MIRNNWRLKNRQCRDIMVTSSHCRRDEGSCGRASVRVGCHSAFAAGGFLGVPFWPVWLVVEVRLSQGPPSRQD